MLFDDQFNNFLHQNVHNLNFRTPSMFKREEDVRLVRISTTKVLADNISL